MIKILCLFFLLMFSNFAFAKDYQGTSECFIADISTKNIAIELARDMAKRSALEQAGTFVTSVSESSKGLLTKDDVKTVTLGFAKLKNGSEKAVYSEPKQDGSIILSYSAVFSIDESEVKANLERFHQNNSEIASLKLQILSQQKSFVEIEKKYKDLQVKYNSLQTDQEKTDYRKQINEVQNDLSASQYYVIATDYMLKNNYKEALIYYDKALGAYDDYAKKNYQAPWLKDFLSSIFFQKGRIFEKDNQLAQAEAFYNAAIQIKPDDDLPYTALSILYMKTGNESGAIAAANAAVKINPNDDTYNGRMAVYGSFKRYKEACSDFWKLKNPLPKATVAGWFYLFDNDSKKALQVFDMALQYNSLDVAAYHGRGRANAGLNKDQDAVNDFTKAVTLDPSDFHAYAERGVSYVFLKQYQLAYNDAILALSHNPNDEQALWVIQEVNKRRN